MAKIVEVDVISTQRIRETYRMVIDCDVNEFRRAVEHNGWLVVGDWFGGVPTDSTLVDSDYCECIDMKFMSLDVIDPDYKRGYSDE